jgi:signal transduction histidine kinase
VSPARVPLLSLVLRTEQDVVLSRRLAREAAQSLGFEQVDRTRIATAVSEVARNAYLYAGGGQVELEADEHQLLIRVLDRGPGLPHLAQVLSGTYRSPTGMGLGLLGAHRLMDGVEVRPREGGGTEVRMRKARPGKAPALSPEALAALALQLGPLPGGTLLEEVAAQNQEVVRALEALHERQEALERLNVELEETNRGVVALYAELEEKAEALRRASELKSRFLSNASHEFRTPLSSIRGLTYLLLERQDGALTQEQERQVSFIRSSAETLSELVEDLLDLGKLESGRTEVRPRRFEVQEVFAALRGMLRPVHASQQVALVMEAEPGLPPLFTDEGKLAQVLRNLLSNALKFTEQGEVRLLARRGPDSLVAFQVDARHVRPPGARGAPAGAGHPGRAGGAAHRGAPAARGGGSAAAGVSGPLPQARAEPGAGGFAGAPGPRAPHLCPARGGPAWLTPPPPPPSSTSTTTTPAATCSPAPCSAAATGCWRPPPAPRPWPRWSWGRTWWCWT